MTQFRRLLLAFAAFTSISIASHAASAATLAVGSEIDFQGGVDPFNGANVYNSTGLDFRTNGNPSLGTPGTIGLTNTSAGSFSVFNAALCPSATVGGCGTIVDLTSFNVALQTLITPGLPIPNFLQFTQGGNTLSFTLTSFAITETQPTGNTLGTLTLGGGGIATLTGFDPTPAIFTITAQGPGNTSFSGSLLVSPVLVPEPASMLLVASGLAGLGLLRRKAKATA